MGLSYEYSIGSVRAREVSLFTKQDVERMASMKSITELCQFLRDKGFGDGDTPEAILAGYMDRSWAYLRSLAPDFQIFNTFLYQNDVHNLKTILKGTLSGRAYRQLLLGPCSISPDELVSAVENGAYEKLPDWLGVPAKRAYGILAQTVDARLSDAVLDTALLKKILTETKEAHLVFLHEYYLLFAFYCNIKTALRAAKIQSDASFLEEALCGYNDVLLKPQLAAAALKGEPAVLDLLSRSDKLGSRAAAEAYRQSPGAFEKFADNQLMTLTKEKCRYTSEGPEPLLGYAIGVFTQIKAIHIAAAGIRTGTPPETTTERLREVYG